MLACQELIADFDNQAMCPAIESTPIMVCVGCGLLEDRISGDHFTGHQVSADAEMLE
jgi:hypothetical protein